MSRSVSYVAPERGGGGGGGSGAGKAHNSVDTHSGPTTALLLGDPTESEFGDEYRRFDRSRSGSVALPRRRLVSSAVRQQSLATGEGADPEVIEPPLVRENLHITSVRPLSLRLDALSPRLTHTHTQTLHTCMPVMEGNLLVHSAKHSSRRYHKMGRELVQPLLCQCAPCTTHWLVTLQYCTK